MKYLALALGAILVVAIPALAQEHDHDHPAQPPQAQAPQQGPTPGGMMMRGNMQGMMQGMQMGPMLGQHTIPVTVTAIDAKTGLVDVTTGSQAFKLPFPPSALTGVKAGDKITVHIGFHKG